MLTGICLKAKAKPSAEEVIFPFGEAVPVWPTLKTPAEVSCAKNPFEAAEGSPPQSPKAVPYQPSDVHFKFSTEFNFDKSGAA